MRPTGPELLDASTERFWWWDDAVLAAQRRATRRRKRSAVKLVRSPYSGRMLWTVQDAVQR